LAASKAVWKQIWLRFKWSTILLPLQASPTLRWRLPTLTKSTINLPNIIIKYSDDATQISMTENNWKVPILLLFLFAIYYSQQQYVSPYTEVFRVVSSNDFRPSLRIHTIEVVYQFWRPNSQWLLRNEAANI
jgi:hypothetical protein